MHYEAQENEHQKTGVVDENNLKILQMNCGHRRILGIILL